MAEATPWLEREAVAAVVAGARVARMVVTSRRGPVASAQLFSVAEGRLWFVGSRSSARVRVVRRRPDVAVVLRSGSGSAVLTGTAEVLEPWGVDALVRLAAAAPSLARALAGYAVRNSTRLAGFASELLRLPPRPEAIPYDRVILAVTPLRGIVAGGAGVREVMGGWPPGGEIRRLAVARALPAGTGPPALPAAVPAWVASLATDRRPCVVGVDGLDGPLCLPAAWEPSRGRAELSADLALRALAVGGSFPACVALDRSTSLRPSAYTGLVLRGEGRLERAAPDRLALRLRLERVSYWAGFASGTVDAGRRAGRARRRPHPPTSP